MLFGQLKNVSSSVFIFYKKNISSMNNINFMMSLQQLHKNRKYYKESNHMNKIKIIIINSMMVIMTINMVIMIINMVRMIIGQGSLLLDKQYVHNSGNLNAMSIMLVSIHLLKWVSQNFFIVMMALGFILKIPKEKMLLSMYYAIKWNPVM